MTDFDMRRYGLVTGNITALTPVRLHDEQNWVVFCFETRWEHVWRDKIMQKFGHYLKEYRRMSFVAVPRQYLHACEDYLRDVLRYELWLVMPTYGAFTEPVL